MLAAPLLAAMALLGWLLWAAWSGAFVCAAFVARTASRPHFWLGVAAAGIAVAWTGWQHCVEVPDAAAIAAGRDLVKVVCASERHWALQLREVTRLVLALSVEAGAEAQRVATMAQELFDDIVGVFFPNRRCRLRGDVQEVAAACAGQPELRAARGAPDCAYLRRAHHDGQRHFHPDHFRLKHPACGAEVLEACSVALNLAVEARRAELGCPAR